MKSKTGKTYEACLFNCIDYAGGIISDVLNDEQSIENQTQLDKKIREASVILGLLDGEKVIDFMNDSPSSIEWINRDLVNIMQVMDRASVPIHFVVSKWDYVESSQFSLQDIINKLLEIQELKMLVENKRDRIRLISVSSVGKGFATFETIANGNVRMLKTGKCFVQPYQVEVPLAYIMIDIIQNASNKLEEKIKNMNAIVKFLFVIKSFFVNPITEFIPPGSQWMSKEFIEKINKNIVTNKFGKPYMNSLADMQHEKAALDHVINCFQYIIDEFQDSDKSVLKTRK